MFNALFWPLSIHIGMCTHTTRTHSNAFRYVCMDRHAHPYTHKYVNLFLIKSLLYPAELTLQTWALITLSLYISFVRHFVIATRQIANTTSVQHPTFQNNAVSSSHILGIYWCCSSPLPSPGAFLATFKLVARALETFGPLPLHVSSKSLTNYVCSPVV